MAIDRQKIIDTLSNLQWTPDDKGLIEKCNVLITRLPSHFWNGFANRLVHKMPSDLVEAAEYLLYNAAHECGYHTGYGIITSQEWQQVIAPMIDKNEDILHGTYAVLAAWGWADAQVVELVPNQKLIVRAYDYYEADSVKYGHAHRMGAYMIAGISAAFMELVYAGDYDPSGKSIGTFIAKQYKGLECGDPYGEFIVTRAIEH
ncbi:MAG: hypothetical protein RIT27_732 [Pseudomonadota bacterium]|jgi:hypothetical protein